MPSKFACSDTAHPETLPKCNPERTPNMNKLLKLIRFFTLLAFLSCFSALPATAPATEEEEEEAPSKLFQLDEMVVTADELYRDVETPNMEVIKPERFPMSLGTTLDTALERQPGIDVQRIQQVGTAIDDDSIKIRGFGARRIKVTRNGRLMNTSGVAGGYFIDWTQIPLHNVDRVEVIKGVSDPRWGSVLGGVVNLVLKKPPREAPLTQVAASFASFETWGFNLYHGWKPGRFEYSIAAGVLDSDGYLRNGDFTFGNVDLHLGYDLPTSTYLWADIVYSKLEKGFIVNNRVSKDFDDPGYDTPLDPDFPASDGEFMYGGMGAYPEPGSWWEKEKWLFDMGIRQDLHEYGTVDLRYWRNHGDREAYNTRTSMDRIFHKNFFDDRSYGVSGEYEVDLSSHTLRAGVNFDYLKDDGDENLPDDFRDDFRNEYYVAAKNLGVYLMGDIRLFSERLWITPGLRYEWYEGKSGPSGKEELIPDIDLDGWAPSLRLTYNYQGDSLLYVSVARALRMPTPPEHYWHYDPDDAGVDTSQLPFNEEDGIMVQGGWRASLPSRTKIEISPYFYCIDDYIQFDLINFVSYNIDQAKLYGVEVQVSQQFPYGFSAFFNYTFQKSETEGDPFVENFVDPTDRDFDEIPALPEHRGNVGVQYKAGNGAKVAVFLQVVSSQEVIYNNNTLWNTELRVREQDAYKTVDLEAQYPVTERFKAGFFARNILDEDYQERFGFPAAGRVVGGTLEAVF
jgi:iron complex outermembrane receptor protein